MTSKRIRNKAHRMRYGYDFPRTGYDVGREIEGEKERKERKREEEEDVKRFTRPDGRPIK